MSDKLRNAYAKISEDYNRKKVNAWKDFVNYFKSRFNNNWANKFRIIDIGGGNGRNLQIIQTENRILFDLSIDLLYTADNNYERVAGALPKLPFRRKAADGVLAIAVIHHLDSEQKRSEAINQIIRVATDDIIISVWRKWRTGVREQIIEAIKNNQDTWDLFNVHLPWHSSDGKIITTRFYHYYTTKELREQILSTNKADIENITIAGGKYNDGNIFMHIKIKL